MEEDIDDIITFFYLEIDDRPEPYEEYESPEEIQMKKEENILKVLAGKPIMHTELDQAGLPVKFVRK